MKWKNNGSEPSKTPKKRPNAFLLVNLLGIDFVVCVFSGYFLGSWLQDLTGQLLWLAAGVLVGTGVGIWSVVVLLIRYTGGGDE